jgi:NET1-associated nuclear protein 1 (U3 small nucleolar RNA-associated protein 17)
VIVTILEPWCRYFRMHCSCSTCSGSLHKAMTSQTQLAACPQCVAFDSKSEHVAAGDASGRIIIWSGLPAAAHRAAAAGAPPPEPRTAGMKLFEPPRWHAHALDALCFSHDGAYLLSGGREEVLVIWQLETFSKTFLPRLGGPLTHIARCPHDAACYAVGQQDNAVRIVSLARMEVTLSVHGVRPPADGAPPAEASAGCCLQPGSGYLVLPGRGGSVQVYDVARDRHVERVQVVARNTVSPTEGEGAQVFLPDMQLGMTWHRTERV